MLYSYLSDRLKGVVKLIFIWYYLKKFRVRSSVVERVPDKNEAVGPIPTAPTNKNPY